MNPLLGKAVVWIGGASLMAQVTSAPGLPNIVDATGRVSLDLALIAAVWVLWRALSESNKRADARDQAKDARIESVIAERDRRIEAKDIQTLEMAKSVTTVMVQATVTMETITKTVNSQMETITRTVNSLSDSVAYLRTEYEGEPETVKK